MAMDQIGGNSIPRDAKADRTGVNLTQGVFEAVVKEVLDSNLSGRLKVWIPELGNADQNDPSGWVTVGYASPFMGKTVVPGLKKKNALNDFQNVEHTYGFWAVPPDVENHVLVLFINGDRSRGYWFACVMDKLGKNMIPGIGGGYADEIDSSNIYDEDVATAFDGSLDPDNLILPTAEIQESDGGNIDEGFVNVQRPIHEYQAKRFFIQGLDRDNVRGARKTSVQLDNPSRVFGISTPGRPLLNDAKDDPSIIAKLDSGSFSNDDLNADGRKGGHHFIMDDGRFAGGGEMVRIRSAEGHQILLDDEVGTMYMINSEGTVWIEMAKSGHLSIYTDKGFNLRSVEDINIHTDASLNIWTGEDINIKSVGDFTMESDNITTTAATTALHFASTVQIGSSGALEMSCGGDGSLNVGGDLLISGASIGLNSGSGPEVEAPLPMIPLLHDDVTWNDGVFQWEIQPAILASIVTIAPTHEPWTREEGEYADKNVTATKPSD